MRKNTQMVLISILVLLSVAVDSEATSIYYEGKTAGVITSTYYDSDFVESWVSVGDKVLFDYIFDTQADPFYPFFSTSLNVPSFSEIPYTTHSTVDGIGWQVTYDSDTGIVGYVSPYGADIPSDWYKMKPGVEYGWWQEILTASGPLGGGWTGEVYYYISVMDWENEIFGSIEGGFTFVTKPVPEPSVIVLLAVGLVGMGCIRFRSI